MEYSKTPLEVLRESRRQYMRELCLVEAEIARREASSVREPDNNCWAIIKPGPDIESFENLAIQIECLQHGQY